MKNKNTRNEWYNERTETIPDEWKEANTILQFKTENTQGLRNYKSITLLSHMYKIYTRIIAKKTNNEIYFTNEVRHGFWKDFSTVDHSSTAKLLIEKADEYHLPLNISLIDYKKTFDTIKEWAKALWNMRIDYRHMSLVQNTYQPATTRGNTR